jgi:hypothetical protein
MNCLDKEKLLGDIKKHLTIPITPTEIIEGEGFHGEYYGLGVKAVTNKGKQLRYVSKLDFSPDIKYYPMSVLALIRLIEETERRIERFQKDFPKEAAIGLLNECV